METYFHFLKGKGERISWKQQKVAAVRGSSKPQKPEMIWISHFCINYKGKVGEVTVKKHSE